MSFSLPYKDFDGDYETDSFEDRTAKNLRAVERALNQNNSRIVHGLVDDTGTVVTGEGFDVSHSATGVFIVTFTIAFATAPTVVAGCPNAAVPQPLATAAGVTMNISDLAGSPVDESFYFIAVL